MRKREELRIATDEENKEYARLVKLEKQKEQEYYKATREVSEYCYKLIHDNIILNGK